MPQIKAIRQGETRYFDVNVWKKLPANKYGWKLVAEVPEEVKAMKEAGSAGAGGKPEVPPTPPVIETKGPPMNATNTIKAIMDAATLEDLDEILQPGEERKSVLSAYGKKKEELS